MAKTKRSSLLAGIKEEIETQGVVEPSRNEPPLEAEGSPLNEVIPASPAKAKPKVSRTTLYLPASAYRKLKEMALAKDCKVHDLVVQGIDKVFKENGYPTVDEFREK